MSNLVDYSREVPQNPCSTILSDFSKKKMKKIIPDELYTKICDFYQNIPNENHSIKSYINILNTSRSYTIMFYAIKKKYSSDEYNEYFENILKMEFNYKFSFQTRKLLKELINSQTNISYDDLYKIETLKYYHMLNYNINTDILYKVYKERLNIINQSAVNLNEIIKCNTLFSKIFDRDNYFLLNQDDTKSFICISNYFNFIKEKIIGNFGTDCIKTSDILNSRIISINLLKTCNKENKIFTLDFAYTEMIRILKNYYDMEVFYNSHDKELTIKYNNNMHIVNIIDKHSNSEIVTFYSELDEEPTYNHIIYLKENKDNFLFNSFYHEFGHLVHHILFIDKYNHYLHISDILCEVYSILFEYFYNEEFVRIKYNILYEFLKSGFIIYINSLNEHNIFNDHITNYIKLISNNIIIDDLEYLRLLFKYGKDCKEYTIGYQIANYIYEKLMLNHIEDKENHQNISKLFMSVDFFNLMDGLKKIGLIEGIIINL